MVLSHSLQVTPASALDCFLVSIASSGTVPASPSPACMGEPAPSPPLATPATAQTGTWEKGKGWAIFRGGLKTLFLPVSTARFWSSPDTLGLSAICMYLSIAADKHPKAELSRPEQE